MKFSSGLCGFFRKEEKPIHIIIIIDTTNQIVVASKDINYKLSSNKPTKLILGGQNDLPIWMQLL